MNFSKLFRIEAENASATETLLHETVSEQQVDVEAQVFCDPSNLDSNAEKISMKGTQRHSGAKFLWQYHRIFLGMLENVAPFERTIFDRVVEMRRTVHRNQMRYVIARRFTLLLFLVGVILTTPDALVSDSSARIFLNILPASEFLPIGDFFSAASVMIGLSFVMYLFNRMLKRTYDDSIRVTTSAISSILQKYTQDLFINGFKKSIENINDEEATFGAQEDKMIWPKRAEKWTRLAYWHGKRIEWTARYTAIEVWITERLLRITDFISRIVTLGIIGVFLILSFPMTFATNLSLQSIFFIITPALIGIVIWDRLGREDLDALSDTLLSQSKQPWKKDADISGEFSGQVMKDKARIQRRTQLQS